MFSKILVANRGEIACRIIKTAKAMGIKTVAVYSDADENALHVEMADEAIYIGPAVAAESYLVIDKIIDACKQTGAEAVHPGYGFLSEQAAFVERLEAEDIVFIGPSREAIKAMGDKITSKKLASEAGVSTVPGHMGLVKNTTEAVKIASQIGYPVMLKASAGGGGKGMRIAWNDDEAREGFERSKSEAESSFGDGRIFIEKFITQPRHIEIQVLGDKHGNIIHLGERECSIQRRNQKVIEEAPSPFIDAKTRKAMGGQAIALAGTVGYASAGTVEFIVDQERNFYFLEMNTRLQVEHPVTELITGIDLVEQMIRIAAGKKLKIKQKDVKLNGWAMESRIYAEDPYKNFLPSIGMLTRYSPPEENEVEMQSVVRNDTGVTEGDEISMFYDPMIAKLCTWGKSRPEAVKLMSGALDAFELEGISHNIPFLSALVDHPRFKKGELTTAFIAEEYPDGFQGSELDDYTVQVIVAAVMTMDQIKQRRDSQITGTLFEISHTEDIKRVAQVGDKYFAAEINISEDRGHVKFEGDEEDLLSLQVKWLPGQTLCEVGIDDELITLKVSPVPAGFRVRHRGADMTVRVMSPRIAELSTYMLEKVAPDTSKFLLSPMPGLVVSLQVEPGRQVEEGQVIAIIEAMKMENVLRAEKAAIVKAIPVKEGDSLAADDIIVEFE